MLKVMIADDEMIERNYLSCLFQKYPEKFHVIGEAKNGKEILEFALIYKPDIIIMDIYMPLMNGLDSALEIKEKFPEILILLNTAYAEFEFARKAIGCNLDAYLLKPAKEYDILETIDTCLKRRQVSNSAPSQHSNDLINTDKNLSDHATDQVARYIDEFFYLPLTLQDLADMAHFTPTYLSRLFHQKKGTTIKSYINHKRLENAKFLLRNSDFTINKIATNSGFSSTSHFNRLFKQKSGCSPLEYRRFPI